MSRRVVLHLCSDFAKQTIYSHLAYELYELGVEQVVFAAVRSEQEASAAIDVRIGGKVTVNLRGILTPVDRVLFRRKVIRSLKSLEETVDLGSIGFVHAHFLYSDGAVALKLKRRCDIPYIVAVRNTDVNWFMRLRPDLIGLASEILMEAEQVIFITPSYIRPVLDKVGLMVSQRVEKKILVIPNGISADWLECGEEASFARSQSLRKHLRVLYVGDFTKNKNIRNLISGVELLNESVQTRLNLVGSGGDDENFVRERSGKDGGIVEWIGRIDDEDVLRSVYRQNDIFAMPSLRETFGVAYIEALSQGLPILHSRGEGVDGYFDGSEVAESVNPRSPLEIAQKIQILASRVPEIRPACQREAKRFSWKGIALQYRALYKEIRQKR